MGSPSLVMIPETRSSSFHGSTDFDKIRTKGRAYSEAGPGMAPRLSDSSNGSTASVNSLAKVGRAAVALTQIFAYSTRKSLAVRKIMAAMRTAYAKKNGTRSQHVSNKT